MGFFSVEFRQFGSSIPGDSEFLEEYRLDVLLLGYLGYVGVNEEWFLWTYIQKAVAGYPIGSVAAIHASAAKQIWKWDMACRAGIDDEHWQCSAAVGGHLLGLKLFRP